MICYVSQPPPYTNKQILQFSAKLIVGRFIPLQGASRDGIAKLYTVYNSFDDFRLAKEIIAFCNQQHSTQGFCWLISLGWWIMVKWYGENYRETESPGENR
jgi:hypothetical protein